MTKISHSSFTKVFLLLSLMAVISFSSCKDDDAGVPAVEEEDGCGFDPSQAYEIFTVVEEMPRFPGCEDMAALTDDEKYECAEEKLDLFIKDNLVYPEEAFEKGKEGTVSLRFVIHVDGTPCNFQILQNPGYGMGEEAKRVLQLIQVWRPAYQRDVPVYAYINKDIKFEL